MHLFRRLASRTAREHSFHATPATLIVVDRSSDAQATKEPRILMGHRSGKHVFMPNTFVFPGGRLDPEDVGIPAHGDLRGPVMQRLQRKASARKARALACAAIRETFEETGLIVGRSA